VRSEEAVGDGVQYDGAANLQVNVETVGGRLRLTRETLTFRAHKVNVQRASFDLPLGEILMVTPAWTKFLGFVPIFPNAMLVRTRTGKTYRLTVFRRQTWITAITSAMRHVPKISA
jgi:hypothetical protein